MSARLPAIWRAAKVPLIYFAVANLIFIGGFRGAIDEFLWGALSFLAYWPFSHVTHYVLWDLMDCALRCDGEHPIFLGLPQNQLWTYFTDVIVGTVWWACVAWAWRKIAARWANSDKARRTGR